MTTTHTVALTTAIVLLVVGGLFFARHGHAHGGWGKHHFCQGKESRMLAKMDRYVEHKLDLKAEQQPLWQSLRTQLNEAQQQWQEKFCASDFRAMTIPAKLDLTEQWLSESVGTLQSLRPTFNAFYDSLDEAQKKKLDRHHHHRHHHDGDDGEMP